LKPEFEDVIVSTTLDNLVSSVKAHIIDLVSLEKIVSRHLIATNQQTLQEIGRKKSFVEKF